jgi:RimJ/RimL family protein N-acetyltransferase
MPRTDLDLLNLQIEALFTHDSSGRILAINEPGGGLAPSLVLGRTREGNLWRLRYDIPQPLSGKLEQLLRNEPVVQDLRLPPVGLAAMRDFLAEHHLPSSSWNGPAYFFPDTLPSPSDILSVDSRTREFIQPFIDPGAEVLDDNLRAHWPIVVRLEAGKPVAMCMSARLTQYVAEAGVETLLGYQGRGHAVAVVAAWAALIRALGRIPLYSTSWENHASQGVARRLGLVLYATNHSIE